MEHTFMRSNLLRGVIACALTIGTSTKSFAQGPSAKSAQESNQTQEHQAKLQQMLNDKAGYAASIVQRWESAARENGRWDESFAASLSLSLARLQPENLLAAGEASTFKEMMHVLGTGRGFALADKLSGGTALDTAVSPLSLGDTFNDLVYTPVTPCRIADTRAPGVGKIGAYSTRSFDVDANGPPWFGPQGGKGDGSCGIPFGVARAVAITLTVTGPVSPGYLTAWAVSTTQPLASVLNFDTGWTIANTTIIPVNPGGGPDINVFVGGGGTDLIADVQGFFAAPQATALDCVNVVSSFVAVPVNVYTAVDAFCPVGYSATGGGHDTNEGTLGYPGVWHLSVPNGNGWRIWVDNQTNGPRNVATWARCCRVPGR
jgi:hypothetical protein